MKRKHSGNIVIHHFWCENTWWLRLIWFLFQISKTKWNEADQTRRRTHLIALHTHTPLPALKCSLRLQEWTLWRTMLLQMMVVLNGSHGLNQFFAQTQPSPNTDLAHTKCVTHRFFKLQINLAPKKTINVPLSPAILQKLPSLWWEFRCQLHTQRQSHAQILTRAIHYLWQRKTRQIVKCHLVTFWRS